MSVCFVVAGNILLVLCFCLFAKTMGNKL